MDFESLKIFCSFLAGGIIMFIFLTIDDLLHHLINLYEKKEKTKQKSFNEKDFRRKKLQSTQIK